MVKVEAHTTLVSIKVKTGGVEGPTQKLTASDPF